MFSADIMRSSASFRTVLARSLGFLHHLEAEDISARPLSNICGSATVCFTRSKSVSEFRVSETKYNCPLRIHQNLQRHRAVSLRQHGFFVIIISGHTFTKALRIIFDPHVPVNANPDTLVIIRLAKRFVCTT